MRLRFDVRIAASGASRGRRGFSIAARSPSASPTLYAIGGTITGALTSLRVGGFNRRQPFFAGIDGVRLSLEGVEDHEVRFRKLGS